MKEITKNLKGHYFKKLDTKNTVRLLHIDKLKREHVWVDIYAMMIEYSPKYEVCFKVDSKYHFDDSYDDLKERRGNLDQDEYVEISKEEFYKEIDILFDKTKREKIK